LANQVHHVLGRYRPDDSRHSWISGLAELQGAQSPLCSVRHLSPESLKATPHVLNVQPVDWQPIDWQEERRFQRYFQKDCRSKAIVLDFLRNQLFKPLDILLLLAFYVFPKATNLVSPFRVGDVLIVSPQGIDSLTQLVNQVVVVIRNATRLTQMLHRRGGSRFCHGKLLRKSC